MRRRAGCAALCALGFVLSSIGVGSKSGLASIDEHVWRFMLDHSGSTQRTIARVITAWGVSGILLPAAIMVAAVAWWRIGSLMVGAVPVMVVQVSSLLVRQTKGHYMVPRPSSAPIALAARNPAFPSGHTANTVAFLVVAAALVWLLTDSRPARMAAVVMAGLGSLVMAWTRLALGVHWFSDVVGGLFLGGAVGFVGAAMLALTSSRASRDESVVSGASGGPRTG